MDVIESRTTPNEFSKRLFAGLPARYNRLAELLSFGQNARWRRAMLDHVVGSTPNVVLDVACGPGAVSRAIAKRTSAQVVGLDLSNEMLSQGAANVEGAGLSRRISLVLGRGEQLPFPDATFDALTFTYLLRYVRDPEATIAELARVVKPGGPIASMEFAVPPALGWRALWWLYTRAVLPLAGMLTGGRAWYDVGRFLGPSISAHYRSYPVEWTARAWEHAGIDHVEHRLMSVGGGLVMWGYKER
ncbi:MAG TPA: class I SAM-dependent methyltransferase [Acidimicrobiales bacterium]|jgi:demethylmenaquinone methyltransferase/2-methoxy-6-polyprenyl-1,4-benzoquinol methylase